MGKGTERLYVHQELRDLVEDVMIHFDDEKIEWSSFIVYGIEGGKSDSNLSSLLKDSIHSDDGVIVWVNLNLDISRAHILKYQDWIQFNSDIKTVILRLKGSSDDISITSFDGMDRISICLKKVHLKNINKYNSVVKEFNKEFSNNLLNIIPKFTGEKIELFICEQKNKLQRGHYFDEYLEPKYFDFESEKEYGGENFYIIKKQKVHSGLIDYFKVIKKYESNSDVFKENSYFCSKYHHPNIMAKVVPKDFSIYVS